MNVLTYEQLKQQFDAVVAGNADLKNAHAAVLEHISVTDKGPAGTAAMIANDALYNTKTHTTSAALAEVEARTVDKAIERITSIMNHQAPAVTQVINVLEVFKKELREVAPNGN